MKMNNEKLIEHSKNLDWSNTEYYLQSYGNINNYFNKLDPIGGHEFIIGAHIVYGWMPTILKLNFESKERLGECAKILNSVKNCEEIISNDDLKTLAKPINNGSLIGTSKLLHFIEPTKYAIWDSNVVRIS